MLFIECELQSSIFIDCTSYIWYSLILIRVSLTWLRADTIGVMVAMEN